MIRSQVVDKPATQRATVESAPVGLSATVSLAQGRHLLLAKSYHLRHHRTTSYSSAGTTTVERRQQSSSLSLVQKASSCLLCSFFSLCHQVLHLLQLLLYEQRGNITTLRRYPHLRPLQPQHSCGYSSYNSTSGSIDCLPSTATISNSAFAANTSDSEMTVSPPAILPGFSSTTPLPTSSSSWSPPSLAH